MVAYSFQKQFAEAILEGRKLQTIRGERKRHARPGEEMQLYVGMRTRHCRLLARRMCISVHTITISFAGRDCDDGVVVTYGASARGIDNALLKLPDGKDALARRDGFSSWSQLKAFWRIHHPGIDRFEGVLISWAPQ